VVEGVEGEKGVAGGPEYKMISGGYCCEISIYCNANISLAHDKVWCFKVDERPVMRLSIQVALCNRRGTGVVTKGELKPTVTCT